MGVVVGPAGRFCRGCDVDGGAVGEGEIQPDRVAGFQARLHVKQHHVLAARLKPDFAARGDGHAAGERCHNHHAIAHCHVVHFCAAGLTALNADKGAALCAAMNGEIGRAGIAIDGGQADLGIGYRVVRFWRASCDSQQHRQKGEVDPHDAFSFTKTVRHRHICFCP